MPDSKDDLQSNWWREAVLEYLRGLERYVRATGVRHHIRELATRGVVGGLRAETTNSDGGVFEFIAWFEFEDDLLRHYVMRSV